MNLPCPSCGTVYDIDLAVYVPGTVFECVRCQQRVTVPASVEEPAAAPAPETPAAAQETRANPIDETDELVDALEELPIAEDDLLDIDEDVDFSELNEGEPAAALGRIEPEKRPADIEPEGPISAITDVQVDSNDTALSFLEANDAAPSEDDEKLELDLSPADDREPPSLDLDFDMLPPSDEDATTSEPESNDEVDIFAVSPELELPTLDFDDPPADINEAEDEEFDPFAPSEDPIESTPAAAAITDTSAPPTDLELSASLELPDLPDLMDALTDDSFVGVNPVAPNNATNPLFDSAKWEGDSSASESLQADLQDTPPPAPQATIPPLPDPSLSAPPIPGGQPSGTKSGSGLFLLAMVATAAALAYVYLYTDFLAPAPTQVEQVAKPAATPAVNPDATKPEVVPQPTTAETPATTTNAEAPKEAEGTSASDGSLTITNKNIDHLSFKELVDGVKVSGEAEKQEASDKTLATWAHIRLAHSFGHEASKEALQDNTESALKFVTEAGRNPKASSMEMAVALGTLAVTNPESEFDPNALRSNALRRKGVDGARYAYALALTLPTGKNHNSRFIGLLDRAISLQPIFPDAVVAKAAHLFERNRITAGVRTIQAFAQKDVPNESLIRLSKILLRRKLYSALSPIAEKIKLTTVDESLAPGLVATFLQIQTYRDVLKGDIAQLIEDTTVSVQKKSKNLSQVIRLVRLQAIANQDAQSTIQIRRGDFDGAELAQLDYEGIRLELQKSPANLEEAQKKLDAFKKDAPKKGNGWVWIATGDLAFARGKYKNAVKHYQKARKVDENLSVALLLTELAQSKVDKRLPNLTRLTKLAKSSKLTAVNYAMGQTMEAKNNVAGAQSLYEMTMWTYPVVGSPLDLVSQFAWVTFQTGDAQRALRIAKEFHGMNPNFAPMVKVLIKMAINARDKDAIAQWYTILDGIEPFNKGHSVELAKAWLNLKNPQKARAVLARLLSEKPQERDAEVTKQLARTWAEDDDAKCRSLLFESIRYKPSSDTYILLAELEVRRQSRNNAIDAYREALKISPKTVSIRFSLIELLLADGKLEESIRELTSITRENPNLARANVLLGDTYRELGKPKEAVAHYYLALRSSKQTEELLLKTARLELYELNQIKHAVENFERVLQINPKNAEAHYRLGFALKDLDQLDRAKAEFNTYLELAADGEFAKEVQGELLNLKD